MPVNPDHYANSKGQVEAAPEGYVYFRPPIVPRSVTYDEELVDLLSRADAQLGRLASVGQSLPNPELLIRPYMDREAVLSSRIEGTQASLSDVLLKEAGAERTTAQDTEEVINYVRALRAGLQDVGKTPLSSNRLRELHAILLRGVRGRDKDPGKFRTTQNWIGPDGCDVHSATYVPPHPDHVATLLADFDSYLANPPRTPILVQAALLHYQFEAIHPFRDGNGRIGRVLIVLFLCERNALSQPLLYLSEYFEARRDDYYRHLRKVSETGDYSTWLKFFLRGVALQAEEALEYTRNLLSLREEYRRRLQAAHATANAIAVADRLFANPYITIPRAAKFLGVTFPTAQRAIETYLVPAGILEEITGQERYRIFRARGVLEALEA